MEGVPGCRRAWSVGACGGRGRRRQSLRERPAGNGGHPVTATGTGPQPILTPGTTAGMLLPGRSSRWLGRTLRIVNAGPRPFYRAAVASLAITSALAMATAALTRPPGSLPESQRHMIAGALVALCISAVLGTASLWRVAGSGPPLGLTAWWGRGNGPRSGWRSPPGSIPAYCCVLPGEGDVSPAGALRLFSL